MQDIIYFKTGILSLENLKIEIIHQPPNSRQTIIAHRKIIIAHRKSPATDLPYIPPSGCGAP